ncbi:cobalamin B12-binding domain-containing protein [Thermodesulfobacteriota bacterium]
MNQEKQIKVLMAKPGLDGHDRGAKVVSLGLKDEGMEVIYTGIRQTPETIVRAAMQEDVDVIGLSLLSGAHKHLFTEIARMMKENEMDNVLLIGGGIIPDEDVPALKEVGLSAIFGPGASIKEIAEYIKTNVRQ